MADTTHEDIPLLGGLARLADGYDAFVIDAGGVLHDGSAAYPGAVTVLENLKAAGKRICLLTNQARRTASAARLLDAMGLPSGLFDHLLTSGELAHQWLRHRPEPWLEDLGTACLHFGPIRDAELIHGLDMEAVDQPYLAQFVLCTGLNDVEEGLADYEEVLRICARAELPMLCADPERWILAGGDRRPGGGALARRYAELGGEVDYCGLPFGDLYDRCLSLLGIGDRSRILAIGDNLATDLAGAEAAGLDTVLVTGGLHCRDLGTAWGEAPDPGRLAALCAAAGRRPRAVLPTLNW
ncbi:TIGR01459 family HAD-type hydrolase [Skermanella mucosa]|uniref:TIGR01459 family HAD-type hydrolase n=1 Tax=Skermanella mucosa TaxID=1789672 RepID=UPI00192C18C4|nr:TIGR01459 family HAD-type hydrolase [Skermanella mucosa]UEM22299.1 TIGR01459 family HAD-type hydrolase [Skermanella mucosa]